MPSTCVGLTGHSDVYCPSKIAIGRLHPTANSFEKDRRVLNRLDHPHRYTKSFGFDMKSRWFPRRKRNPSGHGPVCDPVCEEYAPRTSHNVHCIMLAILHKSGRSRSRSTRSCKTTWTPDTRNVYASEMADPVGTEFTLPLSINNVPIENVIRTKTMNPSWLTIHKLSLLHLGPLRVLNSMVSLSMNFGKQDRELEKWWARYAKIVVNSINRKCGIALEQSSRLFTSLFPIHMVAAFLALAGTYLQPQCMQSLSKLDLNSWRNTHAATMYAVGVEAGFQLSEKHICSHNVYSRADVGFQQWLRLASLAG